MFTYEHFTLNKANNKPIQQNKQGLNNVTDRFKIMTIIY